MTMSISVMTFPSFDHLATFFFTSDVSLLSSLLSSSSLSFSPPTATRVLLRSLDHLDELKAPLELFMLLVDRLGADVNARGEGEREGEGKQCGPTLLHSLFSNPILGRFLVSRGADVLAEDCTSLSLPSPSSSLPLSLSPPSSPSSSSSSSSLSLSHPFPLPMGDTPLRLCLEYGYDWIISSLESNGREKEISILQDPKRAYIYGMTLLQYGGYGGKVREMIEEGWLSVDGDAALKILERHHGRFEELKEAVETFELLEYLIVGEV